MERDSAQQAIRQFREHKGILRTKDALKLGIHPRTLYALRDEGIIRQITRGYYRLSNLPELEHPDLVSVALAVPNGVICFVSALFFHGIGTQIPREVEIAVAKGTKCPDIEYPPVRPYWFSGQAFTAGVDVHQLDGVPVKIYNPAKTIADCFKARNKIGMDVALEALKDTLSGRHATVDEIFQMAEICRVANVMRPYVEALV